MPVNRDRLADGLHGVLLDDEDTIFDAVPALSGLTDQQVTEVRDYAVRISPEAAGLAELDEAITAVEGAARIVRDALNEVASAAA